MTLRFASERIDTTPCDCPACSKEDYGPGKCIWDQREFDKGSDQED